MTRTETDSLNIDPASFKDPDGFVFEREGQIFRALSKKAEIRLTTLFQSGLLNPLFDEGLIIPTRAVKSEYPDIPLPDGYTGLLLHERVDPVTYPSEWTFDMLRDAACITLRICKTLLPHGLILKDANPYNVMYWNGRMALTDVLSISEYEGGPWLAYGQFCETFLYPLFIEAYLGVRYQPYLRAHVNGVPVASIAPLFRFPLILKRGVLLHVFIRHRLERSLRSETLPETARSVNAFGTTALLNLLTRLERVILKLRPTTTQTQWLDYDETHPYSDAEMENKTRFVDTWLDRERPNTVIDLGCNTGKFSLLAARKVNHVAAVDSDEGCVAALYQKLKKDRITNVSPVFCDLMAPTPASGWMNKERRSFIERVKADGFIALALVHHICIGNNVSLSEFAKFISTFGRTGILEWVSKDDEKVQVLLKNREDIFEDYTWENFRKAIETYYEITDISESRAGKRKLCRLSRRGRSVQQPNIASV